MTEFLNRFEGTKKNFEDYKVLRKKIYRMDINLSILKINNSISNMGWGGDEQM